MTFPVSKSMEFDCDLGGYLGNCGWYTGSHQLHVPLCLPDGGNSGDVVLLCLHFVGDEIPEKECCVEWVRWSNSSLSHCITVQ